MRIKKMYQGTVPENKILDTYSTSATDTYSCNYVNGLETYSTNETRIGTWIDGKPIYRKAYTGTTTSSGLKTIIDSTLNDSNIKVINFSGSITAPSGHNQIGLGGYTNNEWYSSLHLDNTGICIYIPNNDNLRSSSYIVVLEYIKTTD